MYLLYRILCPLHCVVTCCSADWVYAKVKVAILFLFPTCRHLDMLSGLWLAAREHCILCHVPFVHNHGCYAKEVVYHLFWKGICNCRWHSVLLSPCGCSEGFSRTLLFRSTSASCYSISLYWLQSSQFEVPSTSLSAWLWVHSHTEAD